MERATPAPKACAERMAVPTFPGSWTPCSTTTRCTEDSSSAAVTSRKGKSPTGPDGVLSVAARFGEISGVPSVPWLLVALRGPLDIADRDASALSRALHGLEVHT